MTKKNSGCTVCSIQKKLRRLGFSKPEATVKAWRIYNHINEVTKVENMSWEECMRVAAKSGVSDPGAFCKWMKQQGRVT